MDQRTAPQADQADYTEEEIRLTHKLSMELLATMERANVEDPLRTTALFNALFCFVASRRGDASKTRNLCIRLFNVSLVGFDASDFSQFLPGKEPQQ